MPSPEKLLKSSLNEIRFSFEIFHVSPLFLYFTKCTCNRTICLFFFQYIQIFTGDERHPGYKRPMAHRSRTIFMCNYFALRDTATLPAIQTCLASLTPLMTCSAWHADTYYAYIQSEYISFIKLSRAKQEVDGCKWVGLQGRKSRANNKTMSSLTLKGKGNAVM